MTLMAMKAGDVSVDLLVWRFFRALRFHEGEGLEDNVLEDTE